MDQIKPLFTATATATGGRNGHTESSDGMVRADLSVPKEMGGPGKPNSATPEHLFAAGYAACFGGAPDFAKSRRSSGAGRATEAASVWLSRCASRTRACHRTNWRRSPRKHTKRSAPIRTPRGGTWQWR